MWDTVTQFLHMDGHGFYVWSVYAIALGLVVLEIVLLRKRRLAAVNRLSREARALRSVREL